MTNWPKIIYEDIDNLDNYSEAAEYYTQQYEIYENMFKKENIKGQKLVELNASIPDYTTKVNSFFVEVSTVLHYIQLLIARETSKSIKFYTEGYNRSLGQHQIKNYAENSEKVIELRTIEIQLEMVRSKWQGISSALERLYFRIKEVMELRKAGLDDLCF